MTAPGGLLRALWNQLGPRLDGGRLVEAALAGDGWLAGPGPLAVLALGKAAGAMTAGLVRALGQAPIDDGLVITSAGAAEVALPPTLARLTGEHPLPGEGSARAAQAALALGALLRPPARLLVLLSGGGSALMAAPAPGLSLEDKRQATAAVARAGASIFELNAVRKHLSAIKGGQLGARVQVPTRVLALSDVVGDDPATIASGPLCADPTRFADALQILDSLVPPPAGAAVERARAHLARGAAGDLPETPKPGDARLAAIEHRILAGPGRVAAEARALIEECGLLAGLLSRDIEAPVAALAQAYAERAAEERAAGGRPRVLIGNGEPRIELPARPGRGGRCTHLALLVARAIAGLAGVTFLAAGTDDRDGNSPAAGALVDGQTWPRAVAQGLDPEQALLGFDSAGPLEALGCLLPPHGTSNLLDLHLLAID